VLDGLRLRRDAGIHPPNFAVVKVDRPDRRLSRAAAGGTSAVDQLRPSVWPASTRPNWTPNGAPNCASQVVAAVENVVYPAYRELRDYLLDLESVATSNDGVWRLPDGDAFYQAAITSAHHDHR
jgi:uncharacterized protein (DUF885 family)